MTAIRFADLGREKLSDFCAECDNCDFLRRRIARRDATIKKHDATIEKQKSSIMALTKRAVAAHQHLDRANEEIKRLGGNEVCVFFF